MATDDAVPKRHNIFALIAGWLGFLAHLPVGVWYLTSGLVAPGWAVVVLIVIWLAFLLLAIYLLRTRPVFTLLVPVAAVALWIGILTAGEAWLGWSA